MAAKTEQPTIPQWENRTTRMANISPHVLAENPKNWRVHTEAQRKATAQSLNRLGFFKPLIAREGSNVLLDGHLRLELAIANGQVTVPVQYVDCTDEEADLALAALDRITEMAETDKDAYAALLESIPVNTDTEALYAALAGRTRADEERAGMVVDHTAVIMAGDDPIDERYTRDFKMQTYDNTTVRQITILMDNAQYEWMLPLMRKVMEREGFETNYEVMVYLLKKEESDE